MRVLRISHSGVVDAWRERERALRRRGVDVRLLTAREWDEAGALVRLEPRADEPVEGVRTWGSHPALFLYDPRPLWRALGEPWDLIDVHEEPFALATAEILALRALRRQRAPYALYSAQNLEKRLPAPFRVLQRRVLDGAAAVSVCNAAAGTLVERRGFPGPARPDPARRRRRPAAACGRRGRPAAPARRGLRRVGSPTTRVSTSCSTRLPVCPRSELTLAGAWSRGRSRFVSGPPRPDLAGRVTLPGPTRRPRARRVLPGPRRARGALADDADVGRAVRPGRGRGHGRRRAGRRQRQWRPARRRRRGRAAGPARERRAPAGSARRTSSATPPSPAAARRRDCASRGRLPTGKPWPTGTSTMYRRATHAGPTSRPPVRRRPRLPAVVVVAYGSPELLRRTLEPSSPKPVDGDRPVSSWTTPPPRPCATSARDTRGALPRLRAATAGSAVGVNLALATTSTTRTTSCSSTRTRWSAPTTSRRLAAALHADPALARSRPPRSTSRVEPPAWPGPSPRRRGAWAEAVGLGRSSAPGSRHTPSGRSCCCGPRRSARSAGSTSGFFLYAEETDWASARRPARLATCRRAHGDGGPRGAGTSPDAGRRETHFHASQELYLRKHHGSGRVAGGPRSAQIAGRPCARSVLPRGRRSAARAPARVSTCEDPLAAETSLPAPPGGRRVSPRDHPPP